MNRKESYSENAYEALIQELFVRFPSVQKQGFCPGAYKPGLDGMIAFDNLLGNPWKQYPCIHVAGTNGKGSVCSIIAASLTSSGKRTGLYTSPHLRDFRERISIPGEGLISKEEVWEFLHTFELGPLSFFEITTGMALWWFAKKKVDYAVIEVGLGGRLDSTNIIKPVVSVVTSIGLDHCSMLGDTREQIAREKAGIFKAGVPAVVGFRDEQTAPVFKEVAESVGAPLFFAPSCPSDIAIDLEGPYQALNIATALEALRVIGVQPSFDGIAHTAQITKLHGRWERLCTDPEIIADIGHNPPALAINFARLSALGRPLVIVYGIMSDKDLTGIAPLMPCAAQYVLCAPATSRAMPVEELHKKLSRLRPDLVLSDAASVSDAVSIAMEKAKNLKNPLVYIGGSTFVLSEAYDFFFLPSEPSLP